MELRIVCRVIAARMQPGRDTVKPEKCQDGWNWDRRDGFILAFLAGLGAIVWGKVAGFEFVWDDRYFIVFNPALRSWSALPSYFYDVASMVAGVDPAHWGVFRPLRNVSWLIDFQIAGLRPGWWHVHNLILHVVNAGLVMLIARRLLPGNRFATAVCGLTFLLHPVQTETVAWVKCRDDLLSTGLTLLVFWLWLKWRGQRSVPRVTVLGVVAMAAFLAKEQAVVLPLLLMAFEGWQRARTDKTSTTNTLRGWLEAWRTVWPAIGVIWGAAGVFVIWRHAVIGRTAQCGYLGGSLLPTLVSMSKAGVEYLRLFLYPVRQLTDYAGFEPVRWNSLEFGLFFGILTSVVVVLCQIRRRLPVAAWGGLWVGICLLPVANLVPMMQYMAERFLYLPGAGFAWLAGAVVVWGYERNHRGTILVAVVILFWLGILTFFRLEVWRNEVAVFQSAVTETADTVLRPRRHLVNTWLEVGKHDAESLTLARQVWEQSRENPAVSTKDRQEDARRYALLLIKTGEEAEGVARMKQLLVDAPEYPTPAFDLGIWEGRRGHYAEALAWFERAMQGGGGDALPTTLYNRGVALRKLGREKEAADSFRQAVEAGASTPEVFHQWLAAVQALGQSAKAAEVRRLAQRYWPGQWTEGEAAEGGGSGSAPHQ